jgi:GNAT superfamily N-acetyltransferase
VSGDALADYPKTIVLTDGAHLLLRPIGAAEDGALGSFRPTRASDPVIAAWDGERAVAAVALERRDARVARLRVTIDPGYRGRRLGTWLLLDGVHLAAALGVERLEAPARPDDAAYLAALARLDFVVDPTADAPSELVLVKRLHRAWTDF